jgi:hypothetical protein
MCLTYQGRSTLTVSSCRDTQSTQDQSALPGIGQHSPLKRPPVVGARGWLLRRPLGICSLRLTV